MINYFSLYTYKVWLGCFNAICLKYKKYSAIWEYGHHFCVDHIDSKRATLDCVIIANFIQDSRASASNTNLLSSQLDYCGTIHDIIEVGFRCFTIFILDVKWLKLYTMAQMPQ